MFQRSRSYKKKKKNVRNVLREIYPIHPPPQSIIHLPVSFPRDPGIQSIQESRSYKKRKKRTLETFLEKSTPLTHHPKHQNLPTGSISKGSGSPVHPREPFLQKRKKKNVNERS